jgi:hypothetical protein
MHQPNTNYGCKCAFSPAIHFATLFQSENSAHRIPRYTVQWHGEEWKVIEINAIVSFMELIIKVYEDKIF